MVSEVSEPRSPSVEIVLETLDRRIRTGEYQNGQALPPERSLAVEFQVSRATIRQAIDVLVTRKRLLRATGCRPRVIRTGDPAAPRGRLSIALWISGNPGDPGAYSVLKGVQHQLNPDAHRLVVDSPPDGTLEAVIRSETAFLSRLTSERDAAGAILWYMGGERNRDGLLRLAEANIPAVFIDRLPARGVSADYVGVDNVEAACEVVAYLIRLGHRRIAHVTNREPAHTVGDRLAGYKAALANEGIPFDPDLVHYGHFLEASPEQQPAIHLALADRILAMEDRPTAVFTVNDYAALDLIEALQSRGVRVPEDMSVAGFDDVERWRPGERILTTVAQPFRRIGASAVKLLMRRIEEGGNEPARHLLLSTELVVRRSTAPPPAPNHGKEKAE